MKILITGGAGFIGSHLVERLVIDGHEVHVWDDLSSSQYRNLEKSIDIKVLDITERERVWDAGAIVNKFDRIYHLACPASPVWYQKDPVKTMLTNVVGTDNMLRVARKTGARILLTSTSEVYGDPLEHPQKESYFGNVNCTGPRACYDEGKRAAETLMYDYHRKYKVDVRVARIFNTYGPRMRSDDGRVVSNFIVAALKEEPCVIHGGSQTRSFCYVDDMVDGLIRLMDSDVTEPVNLGNPHEITIDELHTWIRAFTGFKWEKGLPVDDSKLEGYRQDDPMKRCPDISKARQLLEWGPETDLQKGLEKTIEYFRGELLCHTHEGDLGVL